MRLEAMVRQEGRELDTAAERVLAACGARHDERLVIYTDSGKDPTTVDAFQRAAVAAGCDVAVVTAAARAPMAEPPETALAAMEAADLVLDLASQSWLFTTATGRVLRSGARMLQVLCDENTILTRGTDERVIDRSRHAAALLERCAELRVTSRDGTDVVFRRRDRPVVRQAGFVDEPGAWDSLGMAAVTFYPPETEAEGTIVFNGPLFLIPDHQIVVEEPARARFDNGRIVDVDRSTASGALLDDWLRAQGDEASARVAVVGFGLDHRAHIENGDIMAWESCHGGVIVALGSNIMPVGQGTNEANGHAIGVLLGASVAVDGEPIIEEGAFTHDELR
jgi:2,5-dihydroxypyridine 5,6-dioxygenase